MKKLLTKKMKKLFFNLRQKKKGENQMNKIIDNIKLYFEKENKKMKQEQQLMRNRDQKQYLLMCHNMIKKELQEALCDSQYAVIGSISNLNVAVDMVKVYPDKRFAKFVFTSLKQQPQHNVTQSQMNALAEAMNNDLYYMYQLYNQNHMMDFYPNICNHCSVKVVNKNSDYIYIIVKTNYMP